MRHCTLPHHATNTTAPYWARAWLGLALLTLPTSCSEHTAAESKSPATSSSDGERKADSAPRGAAGAASITTLGGGAGANSVGETADYTVMECSDAKAPANTTDYPACDGPIQCPQGRCIPTDVIAADSPPGIVELLPACSSGKCLPISLRGTDVRFKRCMSLLGEGRCAPECIAVSAMPLGAFLFQAGEAGCGRAEVCAPCTVAGARTGVCEIDECAE